ncbi:MAG: DUF2459 domain-containing protein [Gluconacetobacter diazotrophicus]|nr:DUF2459 domain-containing protein [Gluconacetobacter diazotrophicus]
MVLVALLPSACSGGPPNPSCFAAPPPPTPVLYVVDHGWHTDLVVPAGSLRGPMRRFRTLFPGMRFLLVGFGRRTFMTAPVTGSGDLLIGPFPGRGALLVAALSAPPDRAYAAGAEARIPLPESAAVRLSGFLWRSFRRSDGEPRVIAPGFFPGSLFFDAAPGYSGLYTCNSWTADALRETGLASPPGRLATLFSGSLMRGLAAHGTALCRIGPAPAMP